MIINEKAETNTINHVNRIIVNTIFFFTSVCLIYMYIHKYSNKFLLTKRILEKKIKVNIKIEWWHLYVH